MKYAEFAGKVYKEYAKRFPDSLCYVRIYNCLGKSIDIHLYLSKNGNEVAHGLIDNDMFHFNFEIRLPDNFNVDADDLPEEMTMEKCSSFFWIKPDNTYLCYEKHAINFRKVTGNSDKLIKTVGKISDKILEAVKEDMHSGKIHDNYTDIVGKKIR